MARGTSQKPEKIRTLAALDLGSNSFHLVVANYSGGRLVTIDKLKEMVRLAEGLDNKGDIGGPAMDRAIECLTRFGQRIRELPAEDVRVVGTNTLRAASNSKKFLKRAARVLNHSIDVISGHEEARIIFMGVSHALDDEHRKRLVIDIGGGSTEIIVGKRFRPALIDSLRVGCVSISQRCFSDGKITGKAYDNARNRARQEFASQKANYRKHGWDTAIGASGTMLSAASILTSSKISVQGITYAGLKELRRRVLDAGHISNLSLPGLGKDRAPVFPGGLAIIEAAFEEFDIDELRVSDGALREGLLHEIVGRVERDDTREHTVKDLIGRYHIDAPQAKRVRATVDSFYQQVHKAWNMVDPNLGLSLGWAASLHEIGLDISHSQHHKHGAYLLEHMDMPGFSSLDQLRLAALVRLHRRKIIPAALPRLDEPELTDLLRLAALLRLACLLHRNRHPSKLPEITLAANDTTLTLTLPGDWLRNRPLTELDLAEESSYLEEAGIHLTIKSR